MPVIKVYQLNPFLVVDKVDFSRWDHTPFPHLILTKVQMLAAVDPHEYNIILFCLAELSSLIFPLLESKLFAKRDRSLRFLGECILVRLLLEGFVEDLVDGMARNIEVQKDTCFVLIEEVIEDLLFAFKRDDCAALKTFIDGVSKANFIADF